MIVGETNEARRCAPGFFVFGERRGVSATCVDAGTRRDYAATLAKTMHRDAHG